MKKCKRNVNKMVRCYKLLPECGITLKMSIEHWYEDTSPIIFVIFGISEFSTHKVEFQLGQRFEQRLSGGRNVIEHLCIRPEHHVLVCTTKEFIKNWNLQSRLIFSKEGLTDEKTNLNMVNKNELLPHI